MYPFLKALDVCICQEAESKHIKPGDIVVYKSSEAGSLNVHRVLSIQKEESFFLVKGDNIPSSLLEKVPFSDIKEKVHTVKRGKKVFSLNKFPRKYISRLLASLSRHDLTPLLFKKRFIDPVLLFITANSFFAYIRKKFYGDISFIKKREGEKCHIYAFVRKTRSAEAILDIKGPKGVFISSYIRYRDRNPFFAEKFIKKIIGISNSEYGSHNDIYITDIVLSKLVQGKKGSSSRGKVKFSSESSYLKQLNLYPVLDSSFSDLSPEEKLLILCSRMDMSQNNKELARSLMKGQIDWAYFMRLSKIHMTGSLLYKNLQSSDEAVPEVVMRSLRESAGFVFSGNVRYLSSIKTLADLFREEGLEVLFTKGAFLMMDVYKDKGLRGFSDIDILVREEDLSRVEALVGKKGFKPRNKSRIFNRYRSQEVYSLDNKIYLDIHIDLVGRRLHNRFIGINNEDLWRRKREVTLDGARVYTMDTSYTLLYQSMHLAMQHGFSGLKWYVDIHEMITSSNIDWEEVLRLSGKYRIRRPLYYVLLFTRDMFSTPIPEEVMHELSKIEREFDRYILSKIKSRNAETDYLAELFMFDRTQDTFKFILLSIVTYPYLTGHFIMVFGKMLKTMLWRKPISVPS